MSDVEKLHRVFVRFEAATALISEVGSATDVHLIDVAESIDEGGTNRSVVSRAVERQHRSFPGMPRTALIASSTGGTNLVFLMPEQGQRKVFAGDFAALDELRTPEGQIQRQIRSLRTGSRVAYRERLARRIEFLLVAMKEEGEAWREDSAESLRKMLLFLQNPPGFRYPTVTVTPSATFRAQWTADPRHFALDFLPDGQVRFVMFCPDARHPKHVQRISGITIGEKVMSVVSSFEVPFWASNAGT